MCEDVTARARPSLETIVVPWPIVSNISLYLPVGDLISLSRTNIALRAALHGFGNPRQALDIQPEVASLDRTKARDFLNVGSHGTLYWETLKQLAPFECASKSHTKGTRTHPCRYCSRPICEACIVKDSMFRGKENTFNNRCRYFCPTCWNTGNISKSRRFPLSLPRDDLSLYESEAGTKDEMCVCTLKNNAWLCIPCKIKQNTEATSDAVKQCHGQGCQNLVGADHEKRRVCNWCHKTLLRHLGGTARLEWTQKFIEARRRAELSRQADLAEYNRKRLKLMRMSRRQMRGDEAVKDDPEADLPQFVRHLDTFNYRSFVTESAAPSGNAVYLSKKGHWVYNTAFLVEIGVCCEKLPLRPSLRSMTTDGTLRFARSNLERKFELKQFISIRQDWRRRNDTSLEWQRLEEWHNLKTVILDLLIGQRLPFEQALFSLFQDYDFFTDPLECEFMLTRWGYRWDQVQFLEDPYSGHEDRLDSSTLVTDTKGETSEDKDLEFAKRLQAQMDQETAEELQFTLFDVDRGDVAAGPSTLPNPETEALKPIPDADPTIDYIADPQTAEDPSVPSTPISPISPFSELMFDDPTRPPNMIDDGPTDPEQTPLAAQQPPTDDPPPYNPFPDPSHNSMQDPQPEQQAPLAPAAEGDNLFENAQHESNTDHDNNTNTSQRRNKATLSSEPNSFLLLDTADSDEEDGGADIDVYQSCSGSENGDLERQDDPEGRRRRGGGGGGGGGGVKLN